MKDIKEEVYGQLLEEFKEITTLDPKAAKYIFETWKMTKEIYEHLKLNKN